MAIPASYDINYYRGDTYEFWIDVKDNDGVDVDLSAYTAKFVIASARGASPSYSVNATASIDGSRILCTITPAIGAALPIDTALVYDVQVNSGTTNVYTYLTGNLYMTLDVADA